MKIHFLQNEEIDKTKWNSCVHYANNGNVFGYMWYLNNVSKNWDGLIEDDYVSVLPLIWKPKILNTKVIYQPVLVRSSGIYSVNMLSKQRVNKFLNAIPKEYQQIEMSLNEGVKPSDELDFENKEKGTFQLILNQDYPSIANNYNEDVKTLLQKAEALNLVSASSLKPEVLADFYKAHTTDKIHVEEKFHALQRIMYNVMHRGLGFATGVFDKDNNLLAADFFIFSHGKLMSLIGVTSPKGKELNAHILLVDRIIQTNARRPIILDFNSNDKWLEGFGAKEIPYFSIHRKKGWRKFL